MSGAGRGHPEDLAYACDDRVDEVHHETAKLVEQLVVQRLSEYISPIVRSLTGWCRGGQAGRSRGEPQSRPLA